MMREGHIITTTYFKETDRNAYIHLSSFHHESWLNAVPKGQFKHIRRICMNTLGYYQQADILKSRFLEKGYSVNKINDTIIMVGNMDRQTMLHKERGTTRRSDYNRFEWSMITGFSNQHFSIKKILNKHKGILKNDKVLGLVHPVLDDCS